MTSNVKASQTLIFSVCVWKSGSLRRGEAATFWIELRERQLRSRKYSICMNHNPQGWLRYNLEVDVTHFLSSQAWKRLNQIAGDVASVLLRMDGLLPTPANAEIDSPPLVWALRSSSWFLIPPVKVHFGAKCRQPKEACCSFGKTTLSPPRKGKRSHARKVWWPSPASSYRHCNKVKWVAD